MWNFYPTLVTTNPFWKNYNCFLGHMTIKFLCVIENYKKKKVFIKDFFLSKWVTISATYLFNLMVAHGRFYSWCQKNLIDKCLLIILDREKFCFEQLFYFNCNKQQIKWKKEIHEKKYLKIYQNPKSQFPVEMY